jgi:hypothetical protein
MEGADKKGSLIVRRGKVGASSEVRDGALGSLINRAKRNPWKEEVIEGKR